jgi:hypothetical protein
LQDEGEREREKLTLAKDKIPTANFSLRESNLENHFKATLPILKIRHIKFVSSSKRESDRGYTRKKLTI